MELLDGISGAFERAELGLEQARAGQTIPVEELCLVALVELAVIVYAYFEDENRVAAVTILDGPSSAPPTRG